MRFSVFLKYSGGSHPVATCKRDLAVLFSVFFHQLPLYIPTYALHSIDLPPGGIILQSLMLYFQW